MIAPGINLPPSIAATMSNPTCWYDDTAPTPTTKIPKLKLPTKPNKATK